MSSTPATLSSCAPVLATTEAGSVARVMAASKRCEYSPPPTRAASADAYMVPLDALCSHAEDAFGICNAASQLGCLHSLHTALQPCQCGYRPLLCADPSASLLAWKQSAQRRQRAQHWDLTAHMLRHQSFEALRPSDVRYMSVNCEGRWLSRWPGVRLQSRQRLMLQTPNQSLQSAM